MRRPVAAVVAVVLFAEALGVAALNWFLGLVVDRQNMSLAGLDPDMMSTSSKIGGIVFGLYFVLCGVVALLVLIRNRPPAGLGRILLISVAVVHGLLGAFAWGLVGRSAFAFMMTVLALIVLLLMSYDRQEGPSATEPSVTEPSDAGPSGVAPAGTGPLYDPPTGDAPKGDVPTGDTPRGDAPRDHTPAGDTPKGDGSRGDGPRGDAPVPAPVTPPVPTAP